uniref:Uncharacterized protein n=1 Tax=Callorhinchus milii TaxID=7868 RepID=A0A4W3H5D3_CALMI
MCTTIMVISTLAIILRRRFCNKVQPTFSEQVNGASMGDVQKQTPAVSPGR